MNWLRDNVMGLYHVLVVGLRDAMGRWFIYRDRPDWFVEAMAEQDDEEIAALHSPDATRLVQLARDEWGMRTRKKESQV